MLSMRVVPREIRLLVPKNAKKHSSGLFICIFIDMQNYFKPKRMQYR